MQNLEYTHQQDVGGEIWSLPFDAGVDVAIDAARHPSLRGVKNERKFLFWVLIFAYYLFDILPPP